MIQIESHSRKPEQTHQAGQARPREGLDESTAVATLTVRASLDTG